jgi:hypothetical protein
MKYLFAAVITSLFSIALASGAGVDKHLFILSGQSNMQRLDHKKSFEPEVVAAFGKHSVTVVKGAKKGQPIRRWYKNWKPEKGNSPAASGDLYDSLMKSVKEATKGKKFATVTFIWMQGERDAKERHGMVYAASLKGLKSQLAKDLVRDDIHFVIGRLNDFDLEDKNYSHWSLVRNAQVKVADADPLGAWVNTDDLNDLKLAGGKVRNDIHCTEAGYQILGKRFADKAIELINNKK